MTSPARSTSAIRMSSARPPSGIDSSAFLSSLSAVSRLNGPKESRSFGCGSPRSFIRVVRPLMSRYVASGQAVTAAHDLVRVRRKLRLRAVSGHDKQKQMLGVRLSFGHVHEAPSYARRKRNDVARSDVHELIFRSLVPGATPTAGDRHERLVRVVIVQERASPRLATGKSEIEALRDRHGR